MEYTDRELIGVLSAFINEAGIACVAGNVPDVTFLPGISISRGVIIYDPQRLSYPGDLLHEAGHLAILLPQDRQNASAGDMPSDMSAPAAEMTAIAWSWAALQHLGLPAEILFHKDGYAGGSESLIDNFSNGGYIGAPLLAFFGMTTASNVKSGSCNCLYPELKHWLRK